MTEEKVDYLDEEIFETHRLLQEIICEKLSGQEKLQLEIAANSMFSYHRYKCCLEYIKSNKPEMLLPFHPRLLFSNLADVKPPEELVEMYAMCEKTRILNFLKIFRDKLKCWEKEISDEQLARKWSRRKENALLLIDDLEKSLSCEGILIGHTFEIEKVFFGFSKLDDILHLIDFTTAHDEIE